MSHLKERPEKNCLNCNAVVHGKYCHVCGQENLHPEESVWHLITHVFNDITHFDGKFFSTLKYVILRPGFLSREYKAGRRASYLNPVRMYVFTSAIFFLIFFSVTEVGGVKMIKRTYNGKSEKEILAMKPAEFDSFTLDINDGKRPLTREEFKNFTDSAGKKGGLHFAGSNFKDIHEYDSLVKTGEESGGWLSRKMALKELEMREKYNNDQDKILSAFTSNLVHSFPQILFISLPLFALALKLLYYRRKEYYYVSHAIFGIHFYVFIFIMMFVMLLFNKLYNFSDWSIFLYLIGLCGLLIYFYLYKAMRNFYQQRRAKTILKYLLLNIATIFIIALLFVVFIFFSLLKM